MDGDNECDSGTSDELNIVEEHCKMTVKATTTCRGNGMRVSEQLMLQ